MKLPLIAVLMLLAGCAYNPFLPPKDLSDPLATVPLRVGQSSYELTFTPKYAIAYDLKLTTRHYPLSSGPPYHLRCSQEIYAEGTLIARCDRDVGYGWWSDDSEGFLFPPMDFTTHEWTLVPPGRRLSLIPGKPYTLKVRLRGNISEFMKGYSPAYLEISETHQYDLCM